MTGVLVDGIATEVSALAQTVWLVSESLLFAALSLEDELVTLETG